MSRFVLLALLCSLASTSGPYPALCGEPRPKPATIQDQLNEAEIVIIAKIVQRKAKAKPKSKEVKRYSELHTQKILKSHPKRKTPKIIKLERYIHLENPRQPIIVFLDYRNKKLEPIWGLPATSNLEKYIAGVTALQEKSEPQRLLWYFNYLENKDREISQDAYRQWNWAKYATVRTVAEKLPGGRLQNWLKKKDLPSHRVALYAFLLGHCGSKKDLPILVEQLERLSSGRALRGFALLHHKCKSGKTALAFIRRLLANEKEDLVRRQAVLEALRFFWTTRPDVFSKKEIATAYSLTLDDPKLAYFGVYQLWRWRRWEMAPRILPLFDKKAHAKNLYLKDAILWYALQCPRKDCREFVKKQTKRDAAWVRENRAILERMEKGLKKGK